MKWTKRIKLCLNLWNLGKVIYNCIKSKETNSNQFDYEYILNSAKEITEVLSDKNNVKTAKDFAIEMRDMSRRLRGKE